MIHILKALTAVKQNPIFLIPIGIALAVIISVGCYYANHATYVNQEFSLASK